MHGGPGTNHSDAATPVSSPHQPPAPRPTVLIVEDEGIARNALRRLLAAQGYEICAYESAEEALRDLAERNSPLVALIDVDLPGMSGLDLATQLEQVRPDMVKVLITAAAGDRIESYRRAHEVHYIRKPLDFPRLLRLLGETSLPSTRGLDG